MKLPTLLRWTLLIPLLAGSAFAAERPPNFVIIFADDLGYGDLGCYGHPTIRTPHLDRMAAEGMRFTQFYAVAPVCSPSRYGLLTGRYPIRGGMIGKYRGVLFPNSLSGIQDDEITLAEVLKEKGYATACFGKWHLGHLPQYLPTRHGFDEYFGIPYSNDMRPTPVLRGEETIEEPAVQETLTRRYTDEALRFIREKRDEPFFLYVPHTFPHVPLFASDKFRGRSPRGLYGDVVEELDDSVGRILDLLRELNLAENTFVFFTSDNGPWLIKNLEGGSAGLLREGKGTTWEGGMRVPAIAWWPKTIKPTLSPALACTMDLFPTIAKLAGTDVPAERKIDGVNILPALQSSGGSSRDLFLYYHHERLVAARKGPWKLHLLPQGRGAAAEGYPQLYHLDHDPSEKYDVAGDHPEVVAAVKMEVESYTADMQPGAFRFDELVKE
jgi:arylsulfatase A-like enzyme